MKRKCRKSVLNLRKEENLLHNKHGKAAVPNCAAASSFPLYSLIYLPSKNTRKEQPEDFFQSDDTKAKPDMRKYLFFPEVLTDTISERKLCTSVTARGWIAAPLNESPKIKRVSNCS